MVIKYCILFSLSVVVEVNNGFIICKYIYYRLKLDLYLF